MAVGAAAVGAAAAVCSTCCCSFWYSFSLIKQFFGLHIWSVRARPMRASPGCPMKVVHCMPQSGIAALHVRGVLVLILLPLPPSCHFRYSPLLDQSDIFVYWGVDKPMPRRIMAPTFGLLPRAYLREAAARVRQMAREWHFLCLWSFFPPDIILLTARCLRQRLLRSLR